jgi:hypothetical protein
MVQRSSAHQMRCERAVDVTERPLVCAHQTNAKEWPIVLRVSNLHLVKRITTRGVCIRYRLFLCDRRA